MGIQGLFCPFLMMQNLQCLKEQSCGSKEVCPQRLCPLQPTRGSQVEVGPASRWRFGGRVGRGRGAQSAILSLCGYSFSLSLRASSPWVPPFPWQDPDGSSQALLTGHLWSPLKVMLTPPSPQGPHSAAPQSSVLWLQWVLSPLRLQLSH